MKRALAFALALVCVLSLAACAKEQGKDILNPHFTGKVVKVYEKSCLVEVTDAGNTGLSVGDEVVVNTDVANCPEYAEGDRLRIVFDGQIAESYPMQILKVTTVSKI